MGSDAGALGAALTAAENRAYYEQASLATCAATYACPLAQAHAFLDGDKRLPQPWRKSFETEWGALRTADEEIVAVFLAIAADSLTPGR